MKKYVVGIFTLIIVFGMFGVANAAVRVSGYFKANGTYVAPYYRSSPDSSPYNNYSFPGNTNPYTGVTAGGSVDAYLNNYYKSSGGVSSTYFPSTYIAPLPTKNVSYVVKSWVNSNPYTDCSNSTFLRAKEMQECISYKLNKLSYAWNTTTTEFDGLHYVYNKSSDISYSCKDGYHMKTYGSEINGCTVDEQASICPIGYTCMPVK